MFPVTSSTGATWDGGCTWRVLFVAPVCGVSATEVTDGCDDLAVGGQLAAGGGLDQETTTLERWRVELVGGDAFYRVRILWWIP